ncbi:MAG: hypothetical protein AAFQ41_04235 [Cyanobacteria bacterium J06623_7]
MKRLFVSTLSVLALSTMATPAFANKPVAISSQTRIIRQITPFHLVTNSYQGNFKAQGIPSSNALINAFYNKRIDAKDLVKAGIDTGRLTEATLSDRGYLNAVDSFLDNLDSD